MTAETLSLIPKSVGFIGLGTMGYPMARNLVQKLPIDTKIYVFDVVEKAVDQFIAESDGKAVACTDAKEVAGKSDIILSMVPAGPHVRSVYLDSEHGVLAADVKSKVLIDCSTIDVATSSAVAEAVKSAATADSSTLFYDAPVSGGAIGAVAATLTFMLGCSSTDPTLPLLQALLGLMGNNVFPCGGPTLGLTTKLCNNYLSGLIAIATSEAMNIGVRSGLDPVTLAGIFSTSTAQSCINDKWNPVPGVCPGAPASKGYQPGFRVELMAKDFKLAVETAERVGARLELGEAGLKCYQGASEDERCKGLDNRVVYRYIGGIEPSSTGGPAV